MRPALRGNILVIIQHLPGAMPLHWLISKKGVGETRILLSKLGFSAVRIYRIFFFISFCCYFSYLQFVSATIIPLG